MTAGISITVSLSMQGVGFGCASDRACTSFHHLLQPLITVGVCIGMMPAGRFYGWHIHRVGHGDGVGTGRRIYGRRTRKSWSTLLLRMKLTELETF
jgi:hypothetical protein